MLPTILAPWRERWREYVSEAIGLGLFMCSASAFAVLLFGAGSATTALLPSSDVRRDLMGLAMGATAIALIRSPLGTRSGAHFNPAVTLAFLRLRLIRPVDACWYIVAQLIGGSAAMLLLAFLARPLLAEPGVNFVVTTPGPRGPLAAWFAECVISFLLLASVLAMRNRATLARFTPWLAGLLVALFIAIEAPLSGMSMNPARTLASAFAAGDATALWIYLTAPFVGMLFAAELSIHLGHPAFCARIGNHGGHRCIFRCRGEPT